MKKGGIGGANTKTGADYEQRIDFQTALSRIDGYRLASEKDKAGLSIYFKDAPVARLFRKRQLYKFLAEKGIVWDGLVSSRLEPDEALLINDTLYIIEKKFQEGTGSVDEKLQTCDFKRKKYMKLVAALGLKVEFVYVLNEWFKQQRYKDTLEYVTSSGCHYKFDELPLSWLGLPALDPAAALKLN